MAAWGREEEGVLVRRNHGRPASFLNDRAATVRAPFFVVVVKRVAAAAAAGIASVASVGLVSWAIRGGRVR